MASLKFTGNEKMGLGVELELQLIHPETRDLLPLAAELIARCQKFPDGTRVKSEIFQSMLEIDTPICTSALEAGASLNNSCRLAKAVSKELRAKLIMSGTHPFAKFTDRLLTPSGRYFGLMDRNQWIARRLQIFGMHVHIGMRSGDHAIKMTNALCHYLPLVLAFSASSPYWEGVDTGLASCRITLFESLPTGGHPCLVQSWSEFEVLIERLFRSKAITSMKDLWWDIRPNLDYGTVEVRIADCPPTVKEAEALVALIHSLALMIDGELEAGRRYAPPPEWILRENKWRASRHGLKADLIVDPEGNSQPMDALWGSLKNSLKSAMVHMNYQSQFEFLDLLLQQGGSSSRQRKYAGGGGVAIVDHLEREFDSENPEW